MEAKFRPIPLTILDILAILIPGFTWLVLLLITLDMLGGDGTADTPLAAWHRLAAFAASEKTWFALASLLGVALVIGFAQKPFATNVTEWFTAPLLKLRRRKIPFADLRFPYDGIFRKLQCYIEVQKLIVDVTGCRARELYGKPPFSAAKRYLRQASPALWEESERREAEVRMMGSMFLAALYSIALSGITLAGQLFRSTAVDAEVAGWFTMSLLAAAVLAVNFNQSRIREVGYTYMNALIARGNRDVGLAKDNDDDE